MRKISTLKKNYEFKNVFTQGKIYREKYLNIFIKKNKNNENRIGIAISVKAANAPTRNKIKRLIRENYYKIKDDINLGYDIVFALKKEANISEINFYNIQEDIFNCLKRYKD